MLISGIPGVSTFYHAMILLDSGTPRGRTDRYFYFKDKFLLTGRFILEKEKEVRPDVPRCKNFLLIFVALS